MKKYKLKSHLGVILLLSLQINVAYALDIEVGGECYGKAPDGLLPSLESIVKVGWKIGGRLQDLNYAKVKWDINSQDVGHLFYRNPAWYEDNDFSKELGSGNDLEINKPGQHVIFQNFQPTLLSGTFVRERQIVAYEIAINRNDPNNFLTIKLNGHEVSNTRCWITDADYVSEKLTHKFYPNNTAEFGELRKQYMAENQEISGRCYFKLENHDAAGAVLLKNNIFKFDWKAPVLMGTDKVIYIQINQKLLSVKAQKEQLSPFDRDMLFHKAHGQVPFGERMFSYNVLINRSLHGTNDFLKFIFKNLQTNEIYKNTDTVCSIITKNIATSTQILNYDLGEFEYNKMSAAYKLQYRINDRNGALTRYRPHPLPTSGPNNKAVPENKADK